MAEAQGNAKLGAAVVGGYLLGRFKKGRLALRLASQMSGQTPQEMILAGGKQGAGKVMANAQAKEIVDQVKGPLMEALQGMLVAQVSSRVERLSSGLEAKTTELNDKAKAIETTTTEGAGRASEGAGKAGEKGKGLIGKITGRGKDKNGTGEEGSTEEETTDKEEAPDNSGDEGGDRPDAERPEEGGENNAGEEAKPEQQPDNDKEAVSRG